MKKSELVRKYREGIETEMLRQYKANINCRDIETLIFLWKDGRVDTFDRVNGSSCSPRTDDDLIYVCSVGCDDWADYCDRPEAGQTWEELEEFTKAWMISQYMDTVSDLVDEIIETMEFNEKYNI